jgi:septal ring factor EnvC (AmiA/AmiB activator)
MARAEALGQLQQERAALEGAQTTLMQQEDEVSRLNGELVQISISHEDLHQSLEEQEATVLNLQRQKRGGAPVPRGGSSRRPQSSTGRR